MENLEMQQSSVVLVPPVLLPNCTHSAEFEKIAAALAEAMPNISVAAKDSINPHLKNKYADLANIMEVVRMPLASVGVAILQPPSSNHARSVEVATILLHKSGQWIANTLKIQSVDEKAQSIGSAITYGRRYGLSGLLGIVADVDDDGNGASGVDGKKATGSNAEPQRKPESRGRNNQSPNQPTNGPTGTAPQQQQETTVDQLRAKMRDVYDKPGRPWLTAKGMAEYFNEALIVVGAATYERSLLAYGVKKAEDFVKASRAEDAEKCYRELCGLVVADMEQGAAA